MCFSDATRAEVREAAAAESSIHTIDETQTMSREGDAVKAVATYHTQHTVAGNGLMTLEATTVVTRTPPVNKNGCGGGYRADSL